MNESEAILNDVDRKRVDTTNWKYATQNDIRFLHELSDDQILCMTTTADLLSVAESNRRVVIALKKEAAKTTYLTIIILFLTAYLVYDAFNSEHKNADVIRTLENIEKQIKMNGETTKSILKEMTDQFAQAKKMQQPLHKRGK